MNVKHFGVLAALGFAAGVSPANADIVRYSYAGTVNSVQSDLTPFFPGATAGDPYQAVFVFDTGAASSSTITSTSAQLAGGTSYAPPSPGFPISGTVTISVGGTSYSQSVPGGFYGIMSTFNDPSQTSSSKSHQTDFVSGSGNPVAGNSYTQDGLSASIQGPAGPGGLPVNPNQNFSGDSAGGFTGASSVYWQTQTFDGTQWNAIVNTTIYANITSFSVQDLSTPGAPGPAAGAGLAGLVSFMLLGAKRLLALQ